MELFSGAMTFHCLCTMCGIEDFISWFRKAKLKVLCTRQLWLHVFCVLGFCRECYCGLSLLFTRKMDHFYLNVTLELIKLEFTEKRKEVVTLSICLCKVSILVG